MSVFLFGDLVLGTSKALVGVDEQIGNGEREFYVDPRQSASRLLRDTGEVLGKLDLGKSKEPNYVLDPLTDLIYLRSTDSQVTSPAL